MAPSSSTGANAADQRRSRSNRNRPERPNPFVGIACGRPRAGRLSPCVRSCTGWLPAHAHRRPAPEPAHVVMTAGDSIRVHSMRVHSVDTPIAAQTRATGIRRCLSEDSMSLLYPHPIASPQPSSQPAADTETQPRISTTRRDAPTRQAAHHRRPHRQHQSPTSPRLDTHRRRHRPLNSRDQTPNLAGVLRLGGSAGRGGQVFPLMTVYYFCFRETVRLSGSTNLSSGESGAASMSG